MEKYLTPTEVKKYPLGKKYKKTTYGGSKFFIKMNLADKNSQKIILEFFLKNNHWEIEQSERQKAYRANMKKALKQKLLFLNRHIIKKPANLLMNKGDYIKLYDNYTDADKLGYYKKSSPEYVRIKDILNAINKNSVVYDAGCNSGGIGKILIQRKNCKVFGSEISLKLAKKASKNGLEVFQGWAEKTPFKNNFFDCAILSFILEHVLDPDKLIRETIRVLKEGGKILGHVPTEFGDWGKKTIGFHSEHLRAYSEKELIAFLEKAGLKSIIIKKEKLIGRRIADYYFFEALK